MNILFDEYNTDAEALASEFYNSNGSDGIDHDRLISLIRFCQKQGFSAGVATGFVEGVELHEAEGHQMKESAVNEAVERLTAEYFVER